MSQSHRILVVDDEEGLRVSLSANLELEGYQVVEAASGDAALEGVEEQAFDLVLTDVRMPGLDGVDLFRAIRALRPGAAVVMMTAFTSEKLIEQAMDEGVYAVMTKPFSMEGMLALVRRALLRPVVLVIDDVAAQAVTMAEAFREVGLAAVAVHDGPAAVRRVAEGEPGLGAGPGEPGDAPDHALAPVDACVVDLVMPGMDGLATQEAIHRLDPTIPVVAVTGHAVPDLMHRIMSAGGYACLRKPFETRALLRAVARARGGVAQHGRGLDAPLARG